MSSSQYINDIVDVTLGPGDFFFGTGIARIHTLLGSCVSITLWHPTKRIGGMCHYLLSSRANNLRYSQGYFADEVMTLFLQAIRKANTQPQDYEVKLFGGGNMFESLGYCDTGITVSQANIAAANNLLKQYGFASVKAADTGGSHPRNICFELWNGDVWVKRPRSTRLG
jgi:chemotaxis protein CheD